MFSKATGLGAAGPIEAVPAVDRGRGMRTVVASDTTVHGELVGSGEIRIEGQVEGTIRCGVLVIGKSGRVEGRVEAGAVRIAGRFRGEVKAGTVAMAATAEVRGDVEVRDTLSIEPGAVFEGRTRRAKAAGVARTGAAMPGEAAVVA